jgi:16S rRNA (guanine527-N7)-methyltransferase
VLDRPLAERERDLFCKYLRLLLKWRRSQRLVGSADPAWIVEHLFLDSLLFLRVLPADARALLDLGAGAGLPGVPLSIVRPEIEMRLLEARRRRASFLSTVVRELGLTGARVVNARAEEVLEELAERFDAVVMRCAGDPADVLPLAARMARPGGMVVAAGPPAPYPLPIGEWVTVPGLRAGETRRFAVYRKAIVNARGD